MSSLWAGIGGGSDQPQSLLNIIALDHIRLVSLTCIKFEAHQCLTQRKLDLGSQTEMKYSLRLLTEGKERNAESGGKKS